MKTGDQVYVQYLEKILSATVIDVPELVVVKTELGIIEAPPSKVWDRFPNCPHCRQGLVEEASSSIQYVCDSCGFRSTPDATREQARYHVFVNPPTDSEQVNSPAHYNQGDIKCIDGIRAALSPEEFIGFLKGQIIKYTWRMGHKDAPIQEIEKAAWYAKRLTTLLKEKS